MGPGFKSILIFQKPRLAVAAIVLLIFVLAVAAPPVAHLEKYGFLLASGLGVYTLFLAGKAMKRDYGNLAILLFVSGLIMLLASILATPAHVLAASALEDLVPATIGAITGIFSGIDSD